MAIITCPKSAFKNNIVIFDASMSYDPDGSIASYSFDFGDNSSSVIQTTSEFTHTYSDIGTFTLSLTVTDNKGAKNLATKELIVGGLVMSDPINISKTPDRTSQGARINVDEDGSIYVAWDEFGATYPFEASMFSKSIDGGETFSTPVIAVMPSASNVGIEQVDVVGTDIYVHIVSTKFNLSYGTTEVVSSRSTDGGNSFTTPFHALVSHGLVNSYASSIAYDEINFVGVAWIEDGVGIFFNRSVNNGDWFLDPRIVSDFGLSPDIAIASQNIYVVWDGSESGEPNDEEIFFSRSIDGGLTFSSPINISNLTDEQSGPPIIKVDPSGNIYVVWPEKDSIDNSRIFFTMSTDEGSSFSSPLVLSDPEEDSRYPSIAVSNDNTIYVTWETVYSSDYSIPSSTLSFLVTSSDMGTTFSSPANISDENEEVWFCEVAALGNNKIGLVWHSWDSEDIFYSNVEVLMP